MAAMNGQRLGRLHRLLRHRAGFTQAELSARCDVARWKIVKLEVGALNDLDFGDAERLLGALDARLEVRAWYHGAAGDRRYGWQCRVEVSFADYGERGSIDLLGWHAATRTLVGEKIKSELGAIEGTLRPLDMKCRLAPKVARQQFGWSAINVGRILVLPEDRTARRQVERHKRVLRAALRQIHASCGGGCASRSAPLPASGS